MSIILPKPCQPQVFLKLSSNVELLAFFKSICFGNSPSPCTAARLLHDSFPCSANPEKFSHTPTPPHPLPPKCQAASWQPHSKCNSSCSLSPSLLCFFVLCAAPVVVVVAQSVSHSPSHKHTHNPDTLTKKKKRKKLETQPSLDPRTATPGR